MNGTCSGQLFLATSLEAFQQNTFFRLFLNLAGQAPEIDRQECDIHFTPQYSARSQSSQL